MIDNDDRKAVGMGVIRLMAFVALVLAGAVTAGLALRLFQIVSGI